MSARVIETTYAGCRFRSRLEARWAVFFDALGVTWAYEREAYALGDGLAYLPDFWLPELATWAEVKGHAPTDEEEAKALRLALLTRSRVVMLFDIPSVYVVDDPEEDAARRCLYPELWLWTPIYHPESAPDDPPDGYLLDRRVQWVLCPLCGCLDAVELGANDRMRCGCIPFDGELSVKYEAPRYNAESPRLLTAYHNARAARFGVHETRQKRGVGRRQKPPEARSRAQASGASGCATHSDASPHASLGASGADRGETGGAQ